MFEVVGIIALFAAGYAAGWYTGPWVHSKLIAWGWIAP